MTNGPTEAANNLIKRVKRVAFGFTRFRNYRIRVLLYAGTTQLGPTRHHHTPLKSEEPVNRNEQWCLKFCSIQRFVFSPRTYVGKFHFKFSPAPLDVPCGQGPQGLQVRTLHVVQPRRNSHRRLLVSASARGQPTFSARKGESSTPVTSRFTVLTIALASGSRVRPLTDSKPERGHDTSKHSWPQA